jgi:hypothetical protein
VSVQYTICSVSLLRLCSDWSSWERLTSFSCAVVHRRRKPSLWRLGSNMVQCLHFSECSAWVVLYVFQCLRRKQSSQLVNSRESECTLVSDCRRSRIRMFQKNLTETKVQKQNLSICRISIPCWLFRKSHSYSISWCGSKFLFIACLTCLRLCLITITPFHSWHASIVLWIFTKLDRCE